MIKSFADSETQLVWDGAGSRALPQDIQRRAKRKLLMLDAASSLGDLRNPPGNRLEALVGDRAGLHSIRINDQWRICFRFVAGDDDTESRIEDVEIVDYH